MTHARARRTNHVRERLLADLRGPGGRNAPRPSGEATLADKISGFEECDDCFLTLRRDNGDFDPPFSNVEDGIRRLSLGEDGLTLGVFGYGESAIRLARNASGSNLDFDFLATTENPSSRQLSRTLSPNRQHDGKTCRGSRPTRHFCTLNQSLRQVAGGLATTFTNGGVVPTSCLTSTSIV
jgi:hypothetical protein